MGSGFIEVGAVFLWSMNDGLFQFGRYGLLVKGGKVRFRGIQEKELGVIKFSFGLILCKNGKKIVKFDFSHG